MKILLRNTQPLLGDRLMFTPCVRDLKKTYPDWRMNVISAGPEIWLNNPHLDCEVTEHNADEIYDIGPAKVTHSSKTNGLHAMAAFRTCLEEKMGRPIKAGILKPEVFLSEQDKALRWIDGDYWVINPDTGPFTAKRWPLERFQEVVDSLPEITFCQVGLAKDCRGRLTGPNVIDLVDQTKIRELFSLVYHSQGCISLISSLMHVAAAFDKPCVVIAGGREPPTFERYPHHRFLDNVGCLPCCRLQACWHNALSACEDHDGNHARCMRLIEPPEVIRAIKSYYVGGRIGQAEKNPPTAKLRPRLRIVAKGSYLGGAERSWIEIAKMFVRRSWRVEICPPQPLAGAVRAALPAECVITNHLSRPCDILLFYTSDLVYEFDQQQYEVFGRIQAGRKVMALTYKLGKAVTVDWAQGWDKYLFLSSSLRDGFLAKYNGDTVETAVLAPPVDLTPFLKVEVDYDQTPIHLVRHNSQGDKKFPISLLEIMGQTDARYSFMPAPGFLKADSRITGQSYQSDPAKVAEFLSRGNCFWYLLPEGYTDQGPRVIMEAMAAGLPVLCENRDGPADRVNEQTGWKIDAHQEAVEIINQLTPQLLAEKGRAARRYAIENFKADKWYDLITT